MIWDLGFTDRKSRGVNSLGLGHALSKDSMWLERQQKLKLSQKVIE